MGLTRERVAKVTTEYAMPEPLTNAHRPQTLRGWIASVLMGMIFCIGMPAAITAMAPVTYLRISRQGDLVSAHSQTCLLFVIPFVTQTLENVIEVKSEVQAGEMVEDRNEAPSATNRVIQAEDTGWLILANQDKQLKILVSPTDLENYQRDVRDFINADVNAGEIKSQLRKFCVANWKASVFAGVPLTLLTVLFLVCLVSPLIEHPIRWILRSIALAKGR